MTQGTTGCERFERSKRCPCHMAPLTTVDTASPTAAASRRSALVRALAAPLLFAVVIQNVGNLLLHAILGRYLTADQYGALGTVLSLMVLLTVPLGALQVAASKSAAAGPAVASVQRRSVRSLALAGILATAAVCLLAPLAVSAFHLSSPVDALLLGPFVGVSIVLAVVRGRLLGLDQRRGVRAVAVTFIVSTVVRLVISLAALSTLGTTGAIVGTLVGESLALGYALFALRSTAAAATRPAAANPWLRAGDVGWSGLAIGGLFLFTTIDLFLARHYLDGGESGGYVAAATIGKTLLALPAAALAAAYPRMVAAGTGPGRVAELRRTGIVVSGLALVAATVVALFPGLVLSALYGSSFADQSDVVRILAIVAGLSSVVSVATYALLAVGSRLSLLPWLGAVLEVVAISKWHDSASSIAMASAGALVITLLVCVGALMLNVRSRAPRVHGA